MKKAILILSLTVAVTIGAPAQYQQKYIGMKKAKEIASSQVPGKIKSAEREKEDGKMIYSFDIKTADGQTHEVTLDAFTGAVLTNQIETAEDEAREKAAEKKARKH
ncbi:MAG: PepSY domain-containing protein [Acidobacteriota bacterium]